jgi:hypothetical protein
MSADNYVVVRRFGKEDYRWAMLFASDDNGEKKVPNYKFKHKGFKTAREAQEHAYEYCDSIIEYGISFEEGCLTGD